MGADAVRVCPFWLARERFKGTKEVLKFVTSVSLKTRSWRSIYGHLRIKWVWGIFAVNVRYQCRRQQARNQRHKSIIGLPKRDHSDQGRIGIECCIALVWHWYYFRCTAWALQPVAHPLYITSPVIYNCIRLLTLISVTSISISSDTGEASLQLVSYEIVFRLE